jgi:membrane peptidoglycan carboxypeptidase
VALRAGRRRRPRRRQRRRRRGLFALLPVALLGACLLIATIAYGGTIAIYSAVVADLPDPKDLDTIVLNENTTVYDRTGTVQLAAFGSDRRTEVEFANIPSIVLDTTAAIEDKTYWENSGFDPLGFSEVFDIRVLREAELKHGRIAMLAVLGWIVQETAPASIHPGFPTVS